MKTRKIKDGICNVLTYVASSLSVLVLVAVLVFIFSKGFSLLSFDLLTSDYWANNYMTLVSGTNEPSAFEPDPSLGEDVVYSKEWGIGLKDEIGNENNEIVTFAHIEENSPFASLVDQNDTSSLIDANGLEFTKVTYIDENGESKSVGGMFHQDAKTIVQQLEHATSIESMYLKSEGGGIRGSFITTLYLIAVSLLIALPIGIGAAIYLHEYAGKSKMTKLIRTMIETLTGVPSIVYGLMGVTVLFPFTAMFGATTSNVLLGGLTMAIILLPTIVRSCEEALMVVPQSLRDASFSLGANQTQTIFKVVLPCSISGILTGVLLSVGRVIGESAALIYTMGTFVNDTPSLLTQSTSLSVHIYTIMGSEQPNFELACAISILILIVVLGLNLIVKIIGKKWNKKWC